MSILEAIILGIVQGLTEFLPISSSAHLRVIGDLTGGKDPGAAFTAITQIGTETAVLIYFWKDIVRIVKKWFCSLPVISPAKRVSSADPDVRLGWMVILGSIPIGILGLLLEKWITSTFRNMWITVAMLIIFGIILGVSDRVGKKKYSLEEMSWRDAVIFGFAQALALIPGVSRSGGTITAGCFMGYTRQAAARYSFLLAMPAVFASGFYKFAKALAGHNTAGWTPTIVATLVAFVVGYVVIVWFLKMMETHSFMPFVVYRVVFAVLVAVGILVNILDPLSQGAA